MKFEFGQVIGMDRLPDLRLLVLAPADPGDGAKWLRETWAALVLADDPTDHYSWPAGSVMTVSPQGAGLVPYGNALEG